MTGKPRLYFDHAATSWPKSPKVLSAMNSYLGECGAAAGRGAYTSAQRAGTIIDDLRAHIAKQIEAESRQCISLHSSGTAALNAAIHGIVGPDDHIVSTAAEHNSVLRPLEFLRTRQKVDVTIVPCNASGWVDPEQLLDAVRSDTRLVAMTHVSNVTGTIQAVSEVGSRLKSTDTLLLVDAAQSFGYLPISVRQMGIDLLAFPGHKGGGGPMGTGALYATTSIHDYLEPYIQGGTGYQSDSLVMPNDYPSKLEAGNLNVVGYAGWLAALDENDSHSLDERYARLKHLDDDLRSRFAQIRGVRVIGDLPALPVVSLVIDNITPVEAAVILDSHYGIEARAGLHCAALIHSYLNTQPSGTLRLSASLATTESDVEAVVAAVSEIVSEF
jgi:cysteine desulfurase family protein